AEGLNVSGTGYITGTPSEIVVVPIPEDCHSYYLFSTSSPKLGSTGFYGKLTVVYDDFGNLLSGSGLETVDINSSLCEKSTWLGELIGTEYSADPNGLDESPFYGAVKTTTDTTDFFVFVRNGRKLFRLIVNSNGVSYDNYFVNFLNVVPNVSTLDLNTRHSHELEVIPLDNGNYRLATVVEYTTSISSDN